MDTFSERLHTIKSQLDAHDFYMWLKENQVEKCQGWHFIYRCNGIETDSLPGRGSGRQFVDVHWLWERRKDFNDWIRTTIQERDL